jgi:hypothetical protein
VEDALMSQPWRLVFDELYRFTPVSFIDPDTGMGGYNPRGLVYIGQDYNSRYFYVEPTVIGKVISQEKFHQLCLQCCINNAGRSATDDNVEVSFNSGLSDIAEYPLNGLLLGIALVDEFNVKAYMDDTSVVINQ